MKILTIIIASISDTFILLLQIHLYFYLLFAELKCYGNYLQLYSKTRALVSYPNEHKLSKNIIFHSKRNSRIFTKIGIVLFQFFENLVIVVYNVPLSTLSNVIFFQKFFKGIFFNISIIEFFGLFAPKSVAFNLFRVKFLCTSTLTF